MRPLRPFALLVAALLTACASARPSPEGPPAHLSIHGTIQPRMIDQLAFLYPPDRLPGRVVVDLASGGGDFDTALRLARWLEQVPRSTAVVTRECDSACLIIFTAARERLVDRSAVFGAHAPTCALQDLPGLPCRLFWEPQARDELHDRVAAASPRWAEYLDTREPPAFERRGAELVRVTGDQLIAFGAATPLTRGALSAALEAN